MPLCLQECLQTAGTHTSDPKEQDRHPQGVLPHSGQKTTDPRHPETATQALVLPACGDAATAKQKSAESPPISHLHPTAELIHMLF